MQVEVHLSEDDVLAVQPRGRHGAHEELGPVCVLASVGHGQHARLVVLQLRLEKGGNQTRRTFVVSSAIAVLLPSYTTQGQG